MPLKTQEVFRASFDELQTMHFLSCAECDHTVRLRDGVEVDDDLRADLEDWLCESCEELN